MLSDFSWPFTTYSNTDFVIRAAFQQQFKLDSTTSIPYFNILNFKAVLYAYLLL